MSSSHQAPVEEVSEGLHLRTGSDLRSTRDLEGRSSPWSGHAYVATRRAQGKVRVEENLAANFKRLPLLLFRRRKDGHLIASINPPFSLFPRSSIIARRQRSDHLRRIRKSREK